MTEERPIPKPTGTEADITRIRRVTSHRHREQQPQLNQDLLDTIPGTGSGDQ
jgi:hypothetical protein